MSQDPRIEHIVVLMLENASFDHVLGFLKADNPKIDGLTGTEANPADGSQAGSPSVPVTKAALNSTPLDGGHDLVDVNDQLFSTEKPATGAKAANLGFVKNYTKQAKGSLTIGKRIMDCFDPTNVPVLARLAQEFAVCDRWFSSVPGPTWPNRFFVHAATSDGIVTMTKEDYAHPYEMRTIYDNLDARNVPWRIYFHDVPQSLALSHLRAHPTGFRKFERFAADAAGGDLPAYTFIEPRYFEFFFTRPANDQHPPHDVRLGEHLIADVYEAVRASPLWKKTLLIVLYDEHGGFYDHVIPPAAVNPDGKMSKSPPFDFKRAGLRVPAVLISPFIPKGTVDSTVYDHTSIPATAKTLFGLDDFLTQRDRKANPISTAQWRATPRTDTPARVRRPPLPARTNLAAATAMVSMAESSIGIQTGEASLAPTSELQDSLVTLAQSLETNPLLQGLSVARRLATEHDAAVEVRTRIATLLGV